jgi:hypothetical protein
MSIMELFEKNKKRDDDPPTIMVRLKALHDKLVYQRQHENTINEDASLLLRTARDTILTDEYCDLIFDSDRRKMRIGQALNHVARLIRREEEWEKVMQKHSTSQPGA